MKTNELSFDISSDVLSIGVRGAFLVIDGIINKDKDSALDRLKAETVQTLLSDLSDAKIETDPVLLGFRDLHAAVHRSNRKNVASPENLLNMLLKNGQLPTVNVLVDIYNLVSIRTGLALGAHDLSKVTGNIHLRMTTGAESFWPLGSSAPKPVTPGEYSYIDDANDILCRLEVRQVEKTKVTLATQSAFYIIQGNAATDDAYLKAGTEMLVELTKRFCGGQERLLYAPWIRTTR